MDKMGWDYFTLQATPDHIIQKLKFFWRIQSIHDEAGQPVPKTKRK
jgi:hypothetical protein